MKTYHTSKTDKAHMTLHGNMKAFNAVIAMIIAPLILDE